MMLPILLCKDFIVCLIIGPTKNTFFDVLGISTKVCDFNIFQGAFWSEFIYLLL